MAAAVEKLHPEVELRLRDRRRGHEDDLLHALRARQEQAGLHAVGLQRRHRHLHREDRAQAADRTGAPGADDLSRLGRCTRSARNAGSSRKPTPTRLVKGGVPVEEIIASLFEAVVQQNLATLTKGNTPAPRGAAARRTEPVLQGSAGSLAPSSSADVERARVSRCPTERRTTSSGSRRTRSTMRASAAWRSRKPKGRPPHAIKALKGCAGGSSRASTSTRPRKAAKGLVASDAELGAFLQRYGELKRNDRSSARSTEPKADRPYRRRAGADRLRFRQHHRQGGGRRAGHDAALHLLRPVEGQSDRGRQGSVSARFARPASARSAPSRSPATARTC